MSREPYCPRCGVVEQEHSKLYCNRIADAEFLIKYLRENIETICAQLVKTRSVTAKRLRQALRYRRAFRVIADTGIYPRAIIGGPNAYSERSEWQNGWNACAMEIAKKIASALAARSIEDPDFEPVKEGAQ